MTRNFFTIFKALSCAAIFGAFLYVAVVTVDPDLGIHLAVGEWELREHAVPRADIYSHTMPGYEWVDHEWILDAGLAWMYGHDLSLIAMILFALAAFVPFFVWLRRVKHYEDLWVVILAATATIGFLGVRLQIVSFLLLFLVFELYGYYARHRDERKGRRAFLAFIPFFFVWANLHGGFFSGLLLLWILCGAEWLSRVWKHRGSIRVPWFECGVLVASTLATLVNPYGARLYGLIYETMRSPEVSKYITEWLSPLQVVNIPMYVYIALFLFLAAKFYRRYPLRLLIASLFFFFVFMKSVRMWLPFMVPAMPLVFLGFREVRREMEIAQGGRPLGTTAKRVFLIAAVVLFCANFGVLGYMLFGYHSFPYPDDATAFLKQKVAQGEEIVLMNDYGWGGFLLREAPEIKVFIDGRMPHWVEKSGNSAMKDYVKIVYSDDTAERLSILERRNVNTVLMKQSEGAAVSEDEKSAPESFIAQYIPQGLITFLRENERARRMMNLIFGESRGTDLKEDLLDAGWEVAYEDDVAVVLTCSAVCRGEQP